MRLFLCDSLLRVPSHDCCVRKLTAPPRRVPGCGAHPVQQPVRTSGRTRDRRTNHPPRRSHASGTNSHERTPCVCRASRSLTYGRGRTILHSTISSLSPSQSSNRLVARDCTCFGRRAIRDRSSSAPGPGRFRVFAAAPKSSTASTDAPVRACRTVVTWRAPAGLRGRAGRARRDDQGRPSVRRDVPRGRAAGRTRRSASCVRSAGCP